MIIAVSDPLDPRLADYRNIPDSELLERRGLFIAEGRLVVQRLLSAPVRFVARSVMATESALEAIRPVIAMHPDLPVWVVPQSAMNGVAGFNVHRGCLAAAERPAASQWRDVALDARRIVILERVGDPDNVGSTFRHAAAFGADAVLLDPASADPLYRKAIRTSMGATLTVPFARAGDWPNALGDLGRQGVAVVALTPSATAPCLHTVVAELSGRRVALVLGHEGEGLTQAALEACTHRARIPIAAAVDSLNVSAAAAIALYEVAGV